MPRRFYPTIRLVLAAICAYALVPAGFAEQPADAGPPEPSNARVDPQFESPRATMETFLDAVDRYSSARSASSRREAAATMVAALDLDRAQAVREAGVSLATDLVEILNRIGDYDRELSNFPSRARSENEAMQAFELFPNRLGGAPDMFQTRRLPGLEAVRTEHPGGHIELLRLADGSWRFSARTVDGIAAMRTAVEDVPVIAGSDVLVTLADRVRALVPRALKQDTLVSLEYWQWLGLAIIVFIGLATGQVVRLLLYALWRTLVDRRVARHMDPHALKSAVRPIALLATAGVWTFAISALGLQPTPLAITLLAVRLTLMFGAVWSAWRLVDLAAEYTMVYAKRSGSSWDDLLIPLFRKTAKVVVAVMGVIYIADSLDIQIVPLLTGLGIGGLAIGLAAKDTIENFFGSIAVIGDRPFQVGDWVVINNAEGTIESLGLRSTRIRTFYNSQITVPNAELVRAVVDNYGRRRYRRYRAVLNVTYDTSPARLEAFCSGIRELVRLHPYTRKDYYHAWVNEFGAHSIDILVYIFFETPDWQTELRERHRFMLDILRLADELGVAFAFPTQTIELKRAAPPPEPGCDEPPPANAEIRSLGQGRRAARHVTDQQPWRDSPPGPVYFTGQDQPGMVRSDAGDLLESPDAQSETDPEPPVDDDKAQPGG